MALKITEACTVCYACEPECPNGAITEGEEFFVIDSEKCTECVGFSQEMRCVSVCPVDCCVIDENHRESEEVLKQKLYRLYPEKKSQDEQPSHFSKKL